VKPTVDLKIQLAAALCGPVFAIGYLTCWAWFGHNIPPPSWGYTPAERLANYFQPYHSQIQAGMLGSSVFAIVYLPWTVQLGAIMRKRSPVLANIQLLGGGITAWVLAECPTKWAEAVRISDSNPVLADMLWHEAFTVYECTYLITTVEMVAAGLYALTDRSENPVFPRWTGWLAIGGGLAFVPMSWMPYHDSGPLAVNGAWNFWIVYGWWVIWFIVFAHYLTRAVLRKMTTQDRTPAARSATGVAAPL
jgi:hypothetical protein